MVKSVAVYAASSTQIKEEYFVAAHQLGEIFAANNVQLVYGAGNMGLMGEIADAVLARNGHVVGVIPQFMVEQEWEHRGCTELIVTKDMHERKSTIERISDAMVALPGGVGTFEELLECITWKQLGLHTKPIVILNINGYYDPLLHCLDKMVEENFMRDIHRGLFQVVTLPEEVLPAIEQAPIVTDMRKHAKI